MKTILIKLGLWPKQWKRPLPTLTTVSEQQDLWSELITCDTMETRICDKGSSLCHESQTRTHVTHWDAIMCDNSSNMSAACHHTSCHYNQKNGCGKIHTKKTRSNKFDTFTNTPRHIQKLTTFLVFEWHCSWSYHRYTSQYHTCLGTARLKILLE